MKTEWQKLTTEGKIEAIQWSFSSRKNTSASEIAKALSKELGCEISRNAVIGMFHRHGDKIEGAELLGIHPYAVAPKRPKRPRKSPTPAPKLKTEYTPKSVTFPKLKPPLEPKPAKLNHVPKSPKLLYEMKNTGECKYPISGAGAQTLFCADATKPNSSWCDFCRAVVFYKKAA